MKKEKTEAEKRAQARYDEIHKDEFINYHLKIRKSTNEDVIKKLNSVAQKQTYILELIRADIERNGI